MSINNVESLKTNENSETTANNESWGSEAKKSQLSYKRLVWIWIVSSTLFYYNWNPILPLGIIIVLLFIVFKTQRKNDFKNHTKKFVISCVSWITLWVLGMWFSLYINHQPNNVKFGFNLQLLPVRAINLIKPELFSWLTIFKNNEFINDTNFWLEETEKFIWYYNNEKFETINSMLYDEFPNQEIFSSFKDSIKSFRYIIWEIQEYRYQWYLRQEQAIAWKTVITQSLFFLATIENESKIEKDLIITFAESSNWWKLSWIDITKQKLQYRVSDKR